MARSLARIAAVAVALAFPAATVAAPTQPHLHSLPASTLAQTVTVSWTGSSFDSGYPYHDYLLTVWEYPFGSGLPTSRTFSTDALSTTIDVWGPSRFVVSIRAVEWKLGNPPDVQVSPADSASFTVWTLPLDPPRKG
jgi:hypothetical protein